AKIHSVNHVDISEPWRTEHGFVAFRASARRMRRAIMWAEVRFRLDDAPDACAVHEILSEQLARDDDCVAVVEVASQFSHRSLACDCAIVSFIRAERPSANLRTA